jgi:hypothetical protein
MKNTRPSVSANEIARLSRMQVPTRLFLSSLRSDTPLIQRYAAFVSDRNGELPVPPDAGGVGQRVSLM